MAQLALMPGAIIVGGFVNALGLVRSLAAQGMDVVVVNTRPFDLAHHSRHVSAHDAVARLPEDPEGLVELLERRARDWAGRAVFPASDEAMAALATHSERLGSHYRLIVPPFDVVGVLLDKQRMLDAAKDVGVDVPVCHGEATAATAARDIRFPVVVKPLAAPQFAQHFGTKLFVAASRAELSEQVARMAAAGIPGHVLDLVPGADSEIFAHCTYVDGAGEPARGVTIRKLRQSPPGFGVARIAEIVPTPPELHEASVAILRCIRLRGMASVEFKRDARDGRLRFMEVNGRSVVYSGLLRRGGLDHAALAWADHVLGRPVRSYPNDWPGVWFNLHADLLHAVFSRPQERIGLSQFLAPYRGRPRIEALWSASDPLPFLAQWWGTASGAARARRPRGTFRRLRGAPPLGG